MDITTYGMDIAKNVFQIHWVDATTGEIHRKKLARAKVAEFFAQRQAGRVVMEACGGAHYWARLAQTQGHEVELLPAQQVRPFVVGNKDDAADARAIWMAAQHADIRRVALKTEQQQAELSVHRMRSHWVAMRTATINMLRGLLYEFGVCLPKGKNIGLKHLSEHRGEIDGRLPPVMTQLLNAQLQALKEIEQHVQDTEQQLRAIQKTNAMARQLNKVPGIGLLGSTALAAVLGDGSAWRNAREFATCMGLTPRHSGTGGKVRIGGLSKRGDAYIRTLLINGARSVLTRCGPTEWSTQMLQRRHFNVVTVALAHKLARIAWAIVAHGRAYEPQWKSVPPTQAAQ